MAQLRPHAKFCRNRSNRGRGMAIFQDGGRHHLGFSNFADFNSRTAQNGQTASPCQILSKSVKFEKEMANGLQGAEHYIYVCTTGTCEAITLAPC